MTQLFHSDIFFAVEELIHELVFPCPCILKNILIYSTEVVLDVHLITLQLGSHLLKSYSVIFLTWTANLMLFNLS